MNIITYLVELLEPTLVTALDGDPNSAVAYNFLPGSVLRGALLTRFLQANSREPANLDASKPQVRQLFFDGSVRYLNGYRSGNEAQRCLPIPLSWKQKKVDKALETRERPAPIFDLLFYQSETNEEEWKTASEAGFFMLDPNNRVWKARVDRHLAVHIQRNRPYGRPMPGSGAIYRYDAIEAGQAFKAVILCDEGQDAQSLLDLLSGEVNLGGSRSGGYGRARLSSAQLEKNPLSWREVPEKLDVPQQGKLVVTFLSDALLRDKFGQFAVDVDTVTNAIGRSLGLAEQDHLSSSGYAFLGQRNIGGFNRKWGLPLPQALAVQMGSVLELESSHWDAQAIQALEEKGIGERLAEGFGRIAFDWQHKEYLEVAPKSGQTISTVKLTLQGKGARLAKEMVLRLLREQLDHAVAQKAQEWGDSIKEPKNSQISRLRGILLDLLAYTEKESDRLQGYERLTKYFNKLASRQATRDQFTTDKVDKQVLLDWLKERSSAKEQEKIWNILAVHRSPAIGNIVIHLVPEDDQPADSIAPQLAYEYNLYLIDAVLARAAKERQ